MNGRDEHPVYLDIDQLVERLPLSRRTIRAYAAASPDPLPSYAMPGKTLYRWDEIVDWIERRKTVPVDIEDEARRILKDL